MQKWKAFCQYVIQIYIFIQVPDIPAQIKYSLHFSRVLIHTLHNSGTIAGCVGGPLACKYYEIVFSLLLRCTSDANEDLDKLARIRSVYLFCLSVCQKVLYLSEAFEDNPIGGMMSGWYYKTDRLFDDNPIYEGGGGSSKVDVSVYRSAWYMYYKMTS